MFPYLTTGFISVKGGRNAEVTRLYLRVTDMVTSVVSSEIDLCSVFRLDA